MIISFFFAITQMMDSPVPLTNGAMFGRSFWLPTSFNHYCSSCYKTFCYLLHCT